MYKPKREAVIFINTNHTGASKDALKITKELGYMIILLTNKKSVLNHKSHFESVDEIHYIKTLQNLEQTKKFIKMKLNNLNIKQIMSIVDGYVHLASKLADHFCENMITTKAVDLMEDKVNTRLTLTNQPYNLPFKQVHTIMDLQSFDHMPMIVKPVDGSSSRNIHYIDQKEELDRYSELLNTRRFIVEPYIEGKQFLIECMVIEKEIVFACKVKQWSNEKYGVITNYLLNPFHGLSMVEQQILNSIINQFEMSHGHFHVEFIENSVGIFLIEINPRISGSGMNEMIQSAFGFNYLKEIIRMHLNLPVHIELDLKQKQITYTKHITSKSRGLLIRIKGVKQAVKQKGFVKLFLKPKLGHLLKLPRHMGNRYGFIVAAGDTEQEAIANGETISDCIDYEVESIL